MEQLLSDLEGTSRNFLEIILEKFQSNFMRSFETFIWWLIWLLNPGKVGGESLRICH